MCRQEWLIEVGATLAQTEVAEARDRKGGGVIFRPLYDDDIKYHAPENF
jgi:hypothetical protein